MKTNQETRPKPDHSKLKYYHGMLGYEALYDPETGYFIDVCGNEGYDDGYKDM